MVLFLDENFFNIDGIYDSQNEEVRTVYRADSERKDSIRHNPQKVMAQLGAYSNGITSLVILGEGTHDYAFYM